MSHAFLTQLADGSLEEATFKFYIVQGALYLRCARLLMISDRHAEHALPGLRMQHTALPGTHWCQSYTQHRVTCREYARALALVASKAPRAEWVAFFSKAAHDAFLEESSFHKVHRLAVA
jgi:thiaminase/transcriptional activator TenA